MTKSQVELVLIACSVFFLVLVVSSFVWGVGFSAASIRRALQRPETTETRPTFRLDTARKLFDRE